MSSSRIQIGRAGKGAARPSAAAATPSARAQKAPQALPHVIAARFPGMKASGKHTFYDLEALFDDPSPATCRKGIVFIAMPFSGAEMEDVYAAIRDECQRLGLSPERVDENDEASFIILDIVDKIRKAQIIVFDLTYERPNVYYELGFAHGIGNTKTNVFLIARNGTKIHFDIAAMRVHFYDSTEHLRAIVRRFLKKKVGRDERKPIKKERKKQKARKKKDKS